MEAALRRGDYGFRLTPGGGLEDCPENVELLRRLWIGRELISGDDLGPGDPGDYEFGAWHVSCHLVAAGGVLGLSSGGLAWLEISYAAERGEYYASCTAEIESASDTLPLNSEAARDLLMGSTVLGFVEGTSLGRISAQGVMDPRDRFNGNPRHEYDQPPDSGAEGGKVWEHWCTLRDIRESSAIASSVLASYVKLIAGLGDLFPAVVARGRREYGHPKQLAAMVQAGLVGEQSASSRLVPVPVPADLECLFKEARPEDALQAVERLTWDNRPRYYMFSRRIDRWNAESVFC